MSAYDEIQVTEQPRIRANFPEFIVVHLEDGDALVTCPRQEGRCGNGFVVHYPTWVNMTFRNRDGTLRPYETRACPYCFAAGRIPKMEIIPSHELERS